jgi:1A family penicillin-binding protein
VPDRSPDHNEGAGPATYGGSGVHTATAAKVFLRALRQDLAVLGRRLAAPLAGARTRRRGRRAATRRNPFLVLAFGLAMFAGLALLLMAVLMLWALHDLPLDEAATKARDRSIALEAADGAALGRIGPLKLADAPRSAFPDVLVKAVLATEDRRFYKHRGVDMLGIVRAASRNWEAGTVVEGASTITQQVARLQYLGNERTYERKLREVFLAIWLELHLSKDAILTRYLNGIYMGAGAQGVPAAAQLYFGKAASELTLSEAALLAGLIKAPSRFNPLRSPALAYERAAQVLDAMVTARAIDRRTADEAKAHPATLKQPPPEPAAGTWFSDWVAQEALDSTGSFAGPMRVRTTLVPGLQSIAEQVVGEALRKNEARNVGQAALVAMRPDGSVVAMVGGRDYNDSRFNRAVQAKRQPGSAFKFFVYMAALRSGSRLEDTIDAAPPQINGWEPENYGGQEYGRVTLADAFARSINTATVRLALQVGLDEVIGAARDLGISTPLPELPSLALGAAEVSLLNLTAAFAAVPAGRAPVRPWGVASFASPTEPRLMSLGPVTGPQQPLGDLQAKLTQLLQLPIQRGTARQAALDGLAAGKTGTTQDNRDAWFVGFNESLVVGIWVGNDDRSPMRDVTGGSLPAVMWKEFMTRAAAQQKVAAPGPANAPAVEEPSPRAKCDYRACAAKYQSFNSEDCTYQPYGEARRRQCEIAANPMNQAEPRTLASDDARSRAQCNYDICAQTYSSFRADDCTYQPYDGGARRLCRR